MAIPYVSLVHSNQMTFLSVFKSIWTLTPGLWDRFGGNEGLTTIPEKPLI
jgi:hypothetical protein